MRCAAQRRWRRHTGEGESCALRSTCASAASEAEAKVIREIFRRFAAGEGPRAIARALNERGVPGPRGRPWGDTTIRGQAKKGTGILNNELYRGRQVWGRLHQGSCHGPPGLAARPFRNRDRHGGAASPDRGRGAVAGRERAPAGSNPARKRPARDAAAQRPSPAAFPAVRPPDLRRVRGVGTRSPARTVTAARAACARAPARTAAASGVTSSSGGSWTDFARPS